MRWTVRQLCTPARVSLILLLLAAPAIILRAGPNRYGHSDRVERHMLPAVSAGPLDPAWSPDGKWIAFSMRGDIWKVPADGGTAIALTAGPAYHFEPAWSPDGKRLALSVDVDGNLDIGVVSAEGGSVERLTSDPEVDVEPAWSGDGRHVYFATARGGDFDIYRYSFTDKSRTQVVGGRGNQIQPAVSRDGSKLTYVSPVEGRLGTGGLWVTPLDTDAAPRLVHYEETEYRMKPAWTRDGSAFLYVSDEGGSNDVAIVPAEGGNPIILTADPHDEYAPALSPEGERFAFVSNRSGPTTLFTAPVGGGPSTAWREVSMPVRRPRVASGRLRVRVIGQDQRTMPARIYLQASDGRAYAPDKGFPRVIAATETHYFHTTGQAEIEVPAGRVVIEAMRGHEYRPRKAVVDVPARGAQTVTLQLDRLVDLPARGWYSGDTHVHDLHQGRFGLTHETFFNQLVAEDLHVTNALIHMDGTRLMGRWADLTGAPHRLSTADHILQYAEEFRGSLGHIALLGISRYVLPFTGGTPGTAYVSSLLDHQYVDAARAQGGIAGFVHPYNRPVTRPREATQSLIPVDVALGKGDFYDVGALVSDEIGSAEMYYRLLNCGFRLAATAGTDNFSDVWRDPPPGADRTYVWIDGPLSVAAWLAGIKAQRTFASTGPLLFLEVNGRKSGDEIALGADAPPTLSVRAEAISIAPMERLEILVNGSVAQTVRAADPERIVFDQAVAVPDGGWIAARVVGPSSRYVSDSYAFAQTSPVYVVRNGQRYTSPADAQFLADAVTALGERVEARAKWRTPAERQEFRATIERARGVYQRIAQAGGGD